MGVYLSIVWFGMYFICLSFVKFTIYQMCEPTSSLMVSSSCAPLTRSTSSITSLLRPYRLPSVLEIQCSFGKTLMLLATRKLHWSQISRLSLIYETVVLWNFNSRSSLLALKFRLNGSNRRRREMLKLLRTRNFLSHIDKYTYSTEEDIKVNGSFQMQSNVKFCWFMRH